MQLWAGQGPLEDSLLVGRRPCSPCVLTGLSLSSWVLTLSSRKDRGHRNRATAGTPRPLKHYKDTISTCGQALKYWGPGRVPATQTSCRVSAKTSASSSSKGDTLYFLSVRMHCFPFPACAGEASGALWESRGGARRPLALHSLPLRSGHQQEFFLHSCHQGVGLPVMRCLLGTRN